MAASTSSKTTKEHLRLKVKNGFIEGGELMYMLHSVIQEKLKNLTLFPVHQTNYYLRGGSDWLCTAGRLAIIIPTEHINAGNILKKKLPVNLFVGESQTKLILNQSANAKTERLSFPQNQRLIFLNGSLDLTYQDIITGITSLKNACNYSDADIANNILEKTKIGCKFQMVKDEVINNDFNAFLDFLNALLFGVEASRNNLCFGTSIMVLELISKGQITFKEAFDTNLNISKAGLYPMATIGSGTNSLSIQGMFLKYYGKAMDDESKNKVIKDATTAWISTPTASVVPLREIRLILKWISQRDYSTSELNVARRSIKNYLFSDLLINTYYKEPNKTQSDPKSFNLSIFPIKSFELNYALSNEPILLNGMKVIFDQPVGVYPVTLESKDKEHRNGTHN